MKTPRLSIGLPVYNGEKFLPCTLDSILGQDFTDYELIISDNASTDGTRSICQQYAARDSRIQYFRNDSNIGAAANYRTVFDRSSADLFKWASHDDVHLQGFLRRCVEALDQAPLNVVLVAPKSELIDENGARITKEGWFVESLNVRSSLPHQRAAVVVSNVNWATAQFGVFRAEALRKTRFIDSFVASDYVLLMELALIGEIWEIPEVLFQRRFHAGISTKVNKTRTDFLQWFDPSLKARGAFIAIRPELQPRIKLAIEYVRSILRIPLSRKERLLCLVNVCPLWFYREWQRLSPEYASLLVRNIKKPFQSRAVRAS